MDSSGSPEEVENPTPTEQPNPTNQETTEASEAPMSETTTTTRTRVSKARAFRFSEVVVALERLRTDETIEAKAPMKTTTTTTTEAEAPVTEPTTTTTTETEATITETAAAATEEAEILHETLDEEEDSSESPEVVENLTPTEQPNPTNQETTEASEAPMSETTTRTRVSKTRTFKFSEVVVSLERPRTYEAIEAEAPMKTITTTTKAEAPVTETTTTTETEATITETAVAATTTEEAEILHETLDEEEVVEVFNESEASTSQISATQNQTEEPGNYNCDSESKEEDDGPNIVPTQQPRIRLASWFYRGIETKTGGYYDYDPELEEEYEPNH